MNDYKELIETLNALLSLNDENLSERVIVNNDVQNALLQATDAIEQLVRERDAIERDLAGFEYCPLCAHCHEHIIGTNTETNKEEDLGECGQGNGVFHQLCMNGKFSRCSRYKWRGIQNEI